MDEYLPNQPASSPEKKSVSKAILVATLVIAIALAALGYLWYKTQNSPKSMNTSSQQTATANGQSPAQDTGGPAIILNTQNNSEETGIAIIKETAGKVKVTIVAVGEPKDANQPAHFHTGTCASPGPVVYPLTNVINGASETNLAISLADFGAKLPLILDVHKSDAEIGTSVICSPVTADSLKLNIGSKTPQSTSGATNK